MNEITQAQKQAVDKRFKLASTMNPINAMLYNLAMRSAGEYSEAEHFAVNMQPVVSDSEQFAAMRNKVDLLPLDAIKEKIKLPSAPGVILELQKALDAGASSRRIAQIIQYDLKFTSAILSLVNSPLYALPFKVQTLERAITVIGTREISSLGLGVRILSMFEDSASEDLPLNIFWKHSVACAVLAHDIARLCAREKPERYLVAGLMHDMGRLLFFTNYPELCKACLYLQQKEEIPLLKTELEVFNVEHTMLGGILFGDWKMPKNIIHSALYHHDPQNCLGKDIPEVVYVANQIATALGICCNRFYNLEPAEDIWKKLGIEEDELNSMVDNLNDRLWAIYCSLFPYSDECPV